MNFDDKNEINNFIKLLSKLPGLGPRSGRRAALAIIKQKDADIDKHNRENRITANYLNRVHITSKLDHAIVENENLIKGILDGMASHEMKIKQDREYK